MVTITRLNNTLKSVANTVNVSELNSAFQSSIDNFLAAYQAKGKIVGDKSKIIIKNLNSKKRPISAVADNIEVRNAKAISIKVDQKIKFNLLYDQNRSLQKKIKIEQLRKETKWYNLYASIYCKFYK